MPGPMVEHAGGDDLIGARPRLAMPDAVSQLTPAELAGRRAHRAGRKPFDPRTVLRLQRSAGNAAVSAWLGTSRRTAVQRTCAPCADKGDGPEADLCPTCASDAGVQRDETPEATSPVVMRDPDAGASPSGDAGARAAPDAGARPSADAGAPVRRHDVVLLLGGDAFQKAEAGAVTARAKGERIAVTSETDLLDRLKNIDKPIGTLSIIGHTLSDGTFIIGDDLTTAPRFPAASLAPKLKAALPDDKKPKVVRFLSCSVGNVPKELDRIRQALGAGEATATNCFRIVRTVGPVGILINGRNVTVTSESQLDDEEAKVQGFKAHFEKSFDKLLAKFGDQADCIVGLAPGETVANARAKLRQLYFQSAGVIETVWTDPRGLHAPYAKGTTKCFKDLPVVDSKTYTPGSDCVLVRSTT